MARNEIIIASDPRGVFLEGTVYGTPKPGTCMTMKTGSGYEMDGSGRFTWEVYSPGTDGEQRLVCVLLADQLRGKTKDDAYVSLEHCFLYCPAPGEEMNMLIKNLAGTADDHAFGEILMIDTGTGLLIATTGSPESEPFQLLEAVTDPTADTHALCRFMGQ